MEVEVNQVTEKIIGCFYKVSNTLGGGFLEKVYENATVIEVGKTGLDVNSSIRLKSNTMGLLLASSLQICL